MPWRPARIAAVAALVGGVAAALWVLWGPMIAYTARGGSLTLCLKDFYAPDQFAVMGIARLAQDGLSGGCPARRRTSTAVPG